jgi:glycosyltransferase involved in cell wall biosynthesis
MTAPDGLRVLMTADVVGGVWTYALDLSRELSRRGVKVWLAAMGGAPSEAQRREAEAVPGLRACFRDLRLEWMDEPWSDVAEAGAWLLELERAVRPDLVHLNGYCHGALPFRAPVLLVGHSCVLSWWEAVRGEPAPAQYGRYRAEVRQGVQAAARLVAPSAAMLKALHRHYGAHPTSEVIRNGTWMRGLPLPREPFVLCAARLWDEAKNAEALARAAAGLPWPVRLAGSNIHPATGKAASFPNVQALGAVERCRMPAWYARASIYALPARYEPFGLSILEAARSGCALVLGDIPSLRENWQGAARFVHPDDVAGLHDCLSELMTDSAARETLSRRARARGACLGSGRMARAYLEAYRAMLPPARAADARSVA